MKTEEEIKRKYQEVFQEDGLADGLDERLILHSELRMLKWVLTEGEETVK